MTALLVFGAGGQLGQEVQSLALERGVAVRGVGRADVDITAPGAVEAAIRRFEPRCVLNAAAYTAVDRAESEPAAAERVNVNGAEVLARESNRHGIPLIHISTDYVFDGTKTGAYVETDPIRPLGVYGRTKAEGEARVRAQNPRHVIVRTSWVFSRFGNNFLKTMLKLGETRNELRVVADQFGRPTSTIDIAEAVFAICQAVDQDRQPWGTFHFAGADATSWHGFAVEIFRVLKSITGHAPAVEPIATADYPTAARRPANSELCSDAFAACYGYRAFDLATRVEQTVAMLVKG